MIPKIEGIELHEAVSIFPLMGDAEFDKLVDDIRTHGQREPCSVWQGKLIDGRHRWAACQVLGIEPEVGEFEDENFDVFGYVLSSNLHRRHLTESQRGIVAARLEALLKPKAKERQRKGGKTAGKGRPKQVVPNLGQPLDTETHATRSSEQAAALLNVSRGTVDNARTVLTKGSQELIEATERGEVKVSKAAQIANTTPKARQLEAAKEKKPKADKKTPFQQMQHWWGKASKVERRAFAEWAQEQIEEQP